MTITWIDIKDELPKKGYKIVMLLRHKALIFPSNEVFNSTICKTGARMVSRDLFRIDGVKDQFGNDPNDETYTVLAWSPPDIPERYR